MFLAYKTSAFASLIPYIKRPEHADVQFDKKLDIVGDYPNDMGVGKLVETGNPISLLVCIVEGGDVSRATQFGTRDHGRKVYMSIDLYSHDPDLREQVGDDLYDFCTRNQSLIRAPLDTWFAESVVSKGNTVCNFVGVYRRTYGLWLRVLPRFR